MSLLTQQGAGEETPREPEFFYRALLKSIFYLAQCSAWYLNVSNYTFGIYKRSFLLFIISTTNPDHVKSFAPYPFPVVGL